MSAFLAARRAVLASAILGAVGMSGTTVLAASATWNGTVAADTLWSTVGNWTAGAAAGDLNTTTNTDTAYFTAATNTVATIDTGRNIGSISLSGGGGSTISYFTIGATTGPTLTLTNGGSIISSNKSGAGSSTVAAPLLIAGDGAGYTIESDLLSTRTLILSGTLAGASTGSNVTTVTLQGTGTGSNSLNGVISDGAGTGKLALTKTGTGFWAIGSNANTFTGGVKVSGGTLSISPSGNSNLVLGSGTLTLDGGTLRFGSTSVVTLNNAIVANASTTSIVNYHGQGGVFNPASMSGTGTVRITADSSYLVNAVTFAGFGGTIDTTGLVNLRLDANNFVDGSMANAALNLASGTGVNANFGTNTGRTISIGSLAGAGTLGGSGAGGGTITYSIGNRNDTATTFSGAIVNGGTKSAVAKVGTGAMTLSGTNTYTGGTTISGGSIITANASALGAGTVAVTAGKLKVGDGTTNTVSGLTGLTMADATTLAVASTSSNITLASGNFSLGAITLDLGNLFNTEASYTLITAAAGSTNSIGTVSFLNADTANHSYSFAVDSNTGNGVLTVAAVPEPASLAVLGLGMFGLMGRRRRA